MPHFSDKDMELLKALTQGDKTNFWNHTPNVIRECPTAVKMQEGGYLEAHLLCELTFLKITDKGLKVVNLYERCRKNT